MREIILDTETTGLEPSQGHRIVEIGAVELFNHIPTGRIFHAYLNPERDMPREAEAVHGLTGSFLRDKPLFSSVANELVEFLADSRIVIHNASFDMAFLNSEFANIGKAPIQPGRVTDTLQLARRYRLSSYDASYLELALRSSLPLATLDVELGKAALKAGVARFVR